MKSKEISVLVLSSLILLPFFAGEAFGEQNLTLTITTEKESYAAGEPIRVLGLAENKISDFKVTLRVYNPINNLITIDELDVNSDGTFSGEIATSIGGMWEKDGNYKIIANYYGSEPATVYFEYGVMISAGVQTIPEFAIEEDENLSQTIVLEDNAVDYELTCAEILGMTPDPENKSMIIEIKTDCDGELKITLPKSVIDTDEEGFFVLVDGDETNHDTVSVGEFWTLTIPFSYGSEEIEIIGTFVIPEFGTIAALVLMTAIATIVIISVKNKQIFYPKI